MEYKPRARIGKINIPFGYYVCPTDPKILIPDPMKLDALHYAFRMRAKYKTPFRDCTQWLHARTGQRMTAPGFMYAYQHWVKRLRKEKAPEIAAKVKETIAKKKKLMEENFKQFGISLDDRPDISALADHKAQEKARKKAQVSAR